MCVCCMLQVTSEDGEAVVKDLWQQGDENFDVRLRCSRKN